MGDCMQALRQRETVAYAALLTSHHAHVASLAKQLTGLANCCFCHCKGASCCV